MAATAIEVHPRTHDPDGVWDRLQRFDGRKSLTVAALDPATPIQQDSIRFVCISDTHNRLGRISESLPPGDVLLHAGDFTMGGRTSEVVDFDAEMALLTSYRHKIVIAGNHELCLDAARGRQEKAAQNRGILKHCTYLHDSAVKIFGYKIYGSPWQPTYCDFAFNLERGAPLLEKWQQIPTDTDILLTHGPPLGHGDFAHIQQHVGCVELLETVEKRVRPKFHVFGHIHEGYGVTTNGQTTFVNAAVCNTSYRPVNHAIVFDLPVKHGL